VFAEGRYSIHRCIDRKFADLQVTDAAPASDNQRNSRHELSKSQESKAVPQRKTLERKRQQFLHRRPMFKLADEPSPSSTHIGSEEYIKHGQISG
jgi:hypothetical protein